MTSAASPSLARVRLPWPLPALLTWVASWATYVLAQRAGAAAAVALVGAALLAATLALPVRGGWRRLLVGGGFPLSALALAAPAGWPAWGWLALGAPLALAYPLRAWRDAPFFPTPADALAGLDRVVSLAPGARVVDAGCGLGHGLDALRRVWPDARLEGLEWSRPLAWGAALRCPGARVRRADMWAASWAGADLLYVFQRPESMARVHAKAEREMAPGSWLVSLEFAVPGVAPAARLGGRPRPVLVYRIGADPRPNSRSTAG